MSGPGDGITRRWSQIEPLLDALLDLPAGERAARLERDCPDPALRAAVRELLALEAQEDCGVDRVARAIGGASTAAMAGQLIGPYRVERLLGEGGMGTVFLATRQTAQFTQRVALKLLRVGLYSAAQQELFQREQRIHARLEHPNIARVFDSGITPAGVPYFAMEFIDGEAITGWCDRELLAVDARLRLFVNVCEAVAYAHQNLVVHRDLKPSNILVARDGTPKLLDFGIAKLLPDPAGASEPTQTEWRAFTPGYAAPEQMHAGSITTATDVYALGVILAELLCGARPQRSESGELLGSLTAGLRAEQAQARASTRRALARRLRGDLDAIVRRALQPDPRRRYTGANALREDVLRHLGGRPIRAQPDSLLYRSGKFVQRHRLALAGAAAVALTLVAATLFSVRQARVATREAARANAEAERANAVKQFLLDLFESSAPGDPQHVETADAMLAKGLEQARAGFQAQPDLQVDVLRSVGDIQRLRGRYDDARAPLEQAVAVAGDKLGPGDPRTLDAVFALSRLDEVHNDYAAAQARLDKAVAGYRAAGGPESVPLAHALQQLGVMRLRLQHVDEAIDIEQQALAMYRRLLPDDSHEISAAMIGLGDALDHAGRSEQAIAIFTEVVERSRRLNGDEHELVAEALSWLASPLRDAGRLDEAERALREAVRINRRVFLTPNLHMAETLYELGKTLRSEGKYDEAGAAFAEELELERRLFPNGHPNIASSLKNLATTRYGSRRYGEAEALLREALEINLRLRGPDHPFVAQTRVVLARALIAQGKLDAAQEPLDLALAADRQRFGDSHPSVAADLVASAELAAARGDLAQALDASEHAVVMLDAAEPNPANPARLEAHLHAADYLLALGRSGEAAARFARIAQAANAGRPPVAEVLAHALLGQARAQLALGEPAEARRALAAAGEHVRRIPGDAAAQRGELAEIAAAIP